MSDGRISALLRADRLMLWNLRSFKDRNGVIGLDALYMRLGELLKIPEDVLWLEYPQEQEAGDTYIVRHHMRLALEDLRHLGLVNSDEQGNWYLTGEGAEFLKPLNDEDAPVEGRRWTRETGIELTRKEIEREGALIAHAPRTKIRRPTARGALVSRFEGTCGICTKPIHVRDQIAIEYRRSGTPEVEGWIHVRCSRGGPGGAGVPPPTRPTRRNRVPSGALVSRFEGTCGMCIKPIHVRDEIAIEYRRSGTPEVEGWRHDRCFRGGAGDRARVSPPGNPPRRSGIRRRQFPVEGHD